MTHTKQEKIEIIKHLFKVLNDSAKHISVDEFKLIDSHDLITTIFIKKQGKF